tara:strand:+ start:98268 stop:99038 length:771 start_codon:yes stop_codon:yes gene_type:complete
MTSHDEPQASSKDRRQIAIAVLLFSASLLITVSLVFVWSGGKDEKSGAAAEHAFAAIIPLVGTWIGTVLAYYFSGENFQRATDSVSRLARQVGEERLRTTKVVDAMISMDAAVLIRLPQSDPDGAKINLKTQVQALLNDRITRIPIVDHTGQIKFVLHESIIFRFISEYALTATESDKPIDVTTLTLKDLLSRDDIRNFAMRTIAFVGKEATLAEAKQQMEALSKSQDVFVTDDGTSTGLAIGWVTNVIISRHARA